MADNADMKDSYRSVCYHSLESSKPATITDSDRQKKLLQRIEENWVRNRNVHKNCREAVLGTDSLRLGRAESRENVFLSTDKASSGTGQERKGRVRSRSRERTVKERSRSREQTIKERSMSREHNVDLDNIDRKPEASDETRVSQYRLLNSDENHSVLTSGENQRLLTNGKNQSSLTNGENQCLLTSGENQSLLTNGENKGSLEQPLYDKTSKVEQRLRLSRRSSRSRERPSADQQVRPMSAPGVVSSDSGPAPRVVSSDSGPAPRVVRSVSEPGASVDTCEAMVRSLSQGSEDHEGNERKMELRNLQEELRKCTDFTERRKIRDKIRKLREKKQEVNVSEMGRCSPPRCGRGDESLEVSEKIRNLDCIRDITELRKLLNETNDYDEKKQIRLALRQLRQRDKERENSREAGQIDSRRRSLGSQTTPVVRESGDTPIHRPERRLIFERISENKVHNGINVSEVTETSGDKGSRRQSVTLPIRGHNSHKNHILSNQNKIQCKKKKSEENLVDHKPPIVPIRRDPTHNSQDSNHISSVLDNDSSESKNNTESKVKLQRSNSRSNSVVDTIPENSPSEWLEKKKRSSSLPTSDRSELSTLDMEAAFSELLSAVDDDVEGVSDTEQETAQSKGDTIEEEASHGPMLKVNCNTQSSESRVQPSGSAISIIEGDDGSVTVQSVTQSDQGDRTVTQKTLLRRTDSRSQEEERDTVIESKITSPGGTDNYVKDVIKTRRKLTSRGSDYFTRSAYNIRKKTDFEGEEIEERDFTVENENFSVSKGESWGDRAEAKVQLTRSKQLKDEESKRHILDTLRERESNTDIRERALSPSNKQLEADPKQSVHNRMDISKASSGYGTGSDEEEKEEIAHVFHGKPAGCPEIKSVMRDVSASEGKSVTLECCATCSPPPFVTWFLGDRVVHEGAVFDPVSGKASLTLHNVRRDQMGEYKCVFSNTLGEAQTKAKLTVASMNIRAPCFLSNLVNMVATEGHAVVLECQVADATHIAWYKDGIIQRNSTDFRQTFDGDKAKLEIGEIFLDDHGEYSCIAKNEKGETKTSCQIKVKESEGDGEVAPQFLSRPESNIYSFGDLILLECDVIGSPTPSISWYRDGTKLAPGTRTKSLYDGRVALLKISQSATEDSGKYEVVAQNSCGKVAVDCLVVVKAKEGPPAIHQALSDTVATCGKSLTLQCQIKGSPAPVILWRKDGRLIGNTADFKQTYQNNIALLKIQEVMDQDGGCYECVARNSFGAVSSSCAIMVQKGERTEKEPTGYVSKKTDWLVGRGGAQPEELGQQRKSASVRRSESVRVTSTSNLALKPVFEPSGAKSRERPPARNTTNFVQEESNKTLTKQQETKSHNTPDPKKALIRDHTEEKSASNDKATKKPLEDTASKALTEKSTLQSKTKPQNSHTPVSPSTDSQKKQSSPVSSSTDTQKKQTSVKDVSTAKANDPPWKNISLRRTESARVTNYGREKPLTWKREETEKTKTTVPTIVVENVESKADGPAGWRPVVMENGVEKRTVNLRRSESARHNTKTNVDIISKFLSNSQDKDKKDLNDNKIISVETPQTDSAVSKLKTEATGLNRSQSMRMLFEKMEAKKNLPPAPTPVVTLQRREQGLRRTSSLKVLPGEMESFRAEHKAKEDSSRFANKRPDTSVTMASYDTIEDEEELHKLLSKSENFEERKKIRARMKEIREKKQKEWEAKRLQREKETGDLVKKKFEQAEKEKERYLKNFEQTAKEASAERERILQKGEDLIKDKLKQADEDKKRHLETFDKLAKHDEKKVTIQKTPDGVIRTTIIKDTLLTPADSSKCNSEEAATFLTNQLINTLSPVTSGNITIKTESWNSRNGITNTSQKSQSWGAKPSGAQGAKAMFQKMDNAAPKPNGLLSVSYAKKAATTLRRNAVTIKQEILRFCQKNTADYENVEITNFSSSWNNGMAFCALIHHFYPDSFDFSSLDPKKRRYNFTLAFDTAEKCADIAPLLDVEDMVRMQKPDWK
ncbi:titin homolog isoform X6 [Ostrea edulis]|nr:titin homolog isoform X6 [Ostrea edulis]